MTTNAAGTVTEALTIRLPCLPPAEYSANNDRGRSFWHKQKVTASAYDEIVIAVREQGWHGEPLMVATVKVTFGLPDRRKRDSGGLTERFKPWLDALTRNPDSKTKVWRGVGVLWDDELEVIGWPEYSHVYSPKEPFTEIQILGNRGG